MGLITLPSVSKIVSYEEHQKQLLGCKLRFFEKIGYRPSIGQYEVHKDTSRYRVIVAGSRYGKSMFAGAESAFQLMLPESMTWYVGPTYQLAEKEFLHCLKFLSKFKINGRRLIDMMRPSIPERGSRKIRTPWGSLAQTMSTEKKSQLLGEELDLAILCEAGQIPRSAWNQYLRQRLGSRIGGAIIPSTGSNDLGLFADMVEWGKSKNPKYFEWKSWEFSTKDNPTFSMKEWRQAKKELDPVIFAEQYEGKLVSRRGKVFPQFSDKNIFMSYPQGFEDWPVIRVIHHEKNSFQNPFVCLWIAIEPKIRNFWVYKEYYKKQIVPMDACQIVKEESSGRRIITTITDYYNPTLQDTLRRNLGAVQVNPEKKYNRKHSVVRRIQIMQLDIQANEGIPRIKIHKEKCKNTLEDCRRARFPDARKEEAEMAEAEMPTTKYMSSPQAISYACAYDRFARGIDIYSSQKRIG